MRALVAEDDATTRRFLNRAGRQCGLGRYAAAKFVFTACVVACSMAMGCSPEILTVDSLVLVSSQESMLLAQLEREPVLGFRDGIENVWVRFFVGGRQVAAKLTAAEGRAATFCDLSPPATGAAFEANADVNGRTVRAAGSVFDWRDDLTIIAVDIDGTISDTDFDDLVFDDADRESTPISDSRESLLALANGYHIAYVTSRPRFLLEKTRAWLARYGFPPGPVIADGGLRDFLRQADFKRQTLARFRECWPNLLIGIGDKHRDAVAYRENGMLPVIVTAKNVAQKRRAWEVVVLPSWQDASRFFAANRQILSNARALADTINNHHIQSVLAGPTDAYREATRER